MKNIYKKKNSFSNFKSLNKNIIFNKIKILELVKNDIQKEKNLSKKNILNKIYEDLTIENVKNDNSFKLSPNVIAEINTLDDTQVSNYLFHRYRYEIFPDEKKIDNYPPYLQIEPTSICNYRCVFCYQTDNVFNKKSNNFMGHMSFDLFKEVIDQAENNIEFISLASRGEPLMCKDIEKMLLYTQGKFLNLKINTNASLLTESKAHAILQSGVKTLCFSADAADKASYEKLRVNGKLDRILKNIENFNKIKETKYPNSRIITRVSGVKVNNNQNIDDMQNFWGKLVQQVAFVNYVPWENIYDSKKTDVPTPCSDLWRRMFVWWDGEINPCDVDYKSNLSLGKLFDSSIADIWNSQKYNILRENHLNNKRKNVEPCNRCNVV